MSKKNKRLCVRLDEEAYNIIEDMVGYYVYVGHKSVPVKNKSQAVSLLAKIFDEQCHDI